MSTKLRTSADKIYRHPSMVPIPVPIALDAEAMPGAIVLGEDGSHWASSISGSGGQYSWVRVIQGGPVLTIESETIVVNVDPGQTVLTQISLPEIVTIVSAEVTSSCWVRIYSNPDAATADSARPRNIAPTRGIGVVADPVFISGSKIWWDPVELFVNRQVPRSEVYPLRVTNDSLSATSITITIEYFPQS